MINNATVCSNCAHEMVCNKSEQYAKSVVNLTDTAYESPDVVVTIQCFYYLEQLNSVLRRSKVSYHN